MAEDGPQISQDSAVSIDAALLAAGETELRMQDAGRQRIDSPLSLRGEMARVALQVCGAHSRMIPDQWSEMHENTDPISVRILKNAFVFGGTIRRHDQTHHHGGQLLLTSQGRLIPASLGVMDGAPTLAADILRPHRDAPGRYNLRVFGEPTQLHGMYYFVGSAHRHFGHFLLEGLSRLWALQLVAAEVREQLRFVVYEDALRPFVKDLLGMLGISEDRIVAPGRLAQIDTLIVPDVALRTHRWVSPLQAWAWSQISSASKASGRSRKVFLSRRQVSDRPLDNAAEIEGYFAQRGYEIVCPETLPIGDQVAMARNCESFAGCVGSQMYLAAFQQPGARNIVLAPRNFFLKDDLLIGHCMGHSLTVAFGSAVDCTLPKSERRWHFDMKHLPSL